MDDTSSQEGMDLFDFLFEVWNAKWMFLVIVLLTIAAAAGAASLLKYEAGRNARFGAAVTVNLEANVNPIERPVDPFDRSFDSLWADLKARLPEIDGHAAMDVKDLPEKLLPSTPLPDFLYSTKVAGFSGVLYLDIRGGSVEMAEAARAAFKKAATEQFEDTLAQANKDLALLSDVTNNVYSRNSDLLAERYYNIKRFLDRPDVKAGSAPFFTFGPVMNTEYYLRPGVPRLSTTKVLALGVILGVVLASVAVMFRVAIRRKRAERATA